MKKVLSVVLALAMVLGMSTMAFADVEKQYTFEEAKAYLLDYSDVVQNEQGKDVTLTYEFDSEEQLNSAATYIVEHGIVAFNEKISNDLEIYLQNEEHNVVMPREVSPMSIQKTISGNKTHKILGEAYGLASFATLGTGEYKVDLSYNVVVKNGKISSVSTPKLSFPMMSGGLSSDNISINKVPETYKVSVTARYDIVKKANLGMINIKAETDTEVFGVAALLS